MGDKPADLDAVLDDAMSNAILFGDGWIRLQCKPVEGQPKVYDWTLSAPSPRAIVVHDLFWQCCGGKREGDWGGHVPVPTCDPSDDTQDHHHWDDAPLQTCTRCGTLSSAWEE